jgi:hypothetical protein
MGWDGMRLEMSLDVESCSACLPNGIKKKKKIEYKK